MQKKNLLIVSLIAMLMLIGAGCTKTQDTSSQKQTDFVTPPTVKETQKQPETKALPSDDSRALIQRNQIAKFKAELPKPCEFEKIDALHFSTDLETNWATYKNTEKGLEVSIPYNPEWGSPKYRLNPYDEYNNELLFGTINVRGEGCGAWVQGTQRLTFLPAETKEKVLNRLKKESDLGPDHYDIKTLSIGDKEIIVWNVGALCGGGGSIILGKKYNYELSSTCYSNTREDIIKTMKFID